MQNIEKYFEQVVQAWARVTAHAVGQNIEPPSVLVIDSLNVLNSRLPSPSGEMAEIFQSMMQAVAAAEANLRPRLLIVCLDGYAEDSATTFWEYLADAAFRFDMKIGAEDYLQRSFQIVKIRTQSHAWGRHTFKIFEGSDPVDWRNLSREEAETLTGAPAEQAPLLYTGGTYAFPSLHWHLSRSIREKIVGPKRQSVYPSGVDALDAILADTENWKGFPHGHTTALVGPRGMLKSHLAYHFMLKHALGRFRPPEEAKNVLLISLRDDVDAARATLGTILEQEGLCEAEHGSDTVQQLMNTDRLEVLYNWPGCVSSSEFFHRILVALARERAAGVMPDGGKAPSYARAEIVVLNGLDHLEAKFPLCARERVFVPALVSLFRCHKVCSVVIAAEDGRDSKSSHIAPMADLLLDFSAPNTSLCERLHLSAPENQLSKVCAVRVPAGQVGGRWGILCRDTSDSRMSFITLPERED
jgi:KaiC/GvpD/RAD55 family RecA-like ATPase